MISQAFLHDLISSKESSSIQADVVIEVCIGSVQLGYGNATMTDNQSHLLCDSMLGFQPPADDRGFQAFEV